MLDFAEIWLLKTKNDHTDNPYEPDTQNAPETGE